MKDESSLPAWAEVEDSPGPSKHSAEGMNRRTLLQSLAASPLLALGALEASDAANLTGYWELRIPRDDGTFRKTFFHLIQSGPTVSGAMMFRPRQQPVSNGSFRDGRLHFEIVFHFRGQTRNVSYDGVLHGDKIALRIGFPSGSPMRGPVSAIAERTTRAAALPPAPLPLPALHDVPDNGLARTPPMGWNSWNHFAGRVDDAIIRSMADAMAASGMSRFGYTFINIDDTWQGERDRNGNITGNKKFPDMKSLADYVHSKGLKIGIYTSPGPTTCAGYTGSYGHEAQDARTFADWGFDYLKYDWCSAGEIYKNDDLRPVYQKMGVAIEEVGRPIVFSLCEYGWDNVWTWGAKAGGNLWRTTGDISDNWKRMDEIGFSQFAIARYMQPGHWNDPDMLEVGNGGMTAEEYRTHMSLWCLLGAPLIAGNDLRSMTVEAKSILMNPEVIAIDQDKAAKPPKLVTPLGEKVVVARPLAGGSIAVGLFNRADQADEIGIEWAALGFEGNRVQARDLWEHRGVKASATHYSVKVPPHGVALLEVRAAA